MVISMPIVFLCLMGGCALLTWLGFLEGKAIIVAFVAFVAGLNCGLPESEKQRLDREERKGPLGPIE